MLNPHDVFYLIIVIVVAYFAVTNFLSYLNIKNQKTQLPPELQAVYSQEQYAKSQEYFKARSTFGLLTKSFSFIILLFVLFANGFALVDSIVGAYTQNAIWQALLFFGIIGIIYEILSIPFELYSVFVIEQKFGFNKMTKNLFVVDKIKEILLSAIIGAIILSLIVWLYLLFDAQFWLFALIVITAFSVFMSLFYTQLIVPLFNKLNPLEDGELKDAISAFAKKVSFPIQDVFVIDSSKRSSKSNAYFTGFGKKKKIVLFDTLIKNHTTDELVAVLAHEIGHYKKKHIQQGLLLGVLQMGIFLFLFSLMLSESVFHLAIGIKTPSFHSAVIVFSLLYTPLSFILGLINNSISRKNEYAADNFVLKNNYAPSLQKALMKLSSDNLSNLTPHKWFVKVYYSHPPLLQRLKALNKTEK